MIRFLLGSGITGRILFMKSHIVSFKSDVSYILDIFLREFEINLEYFNKNFNNFKKFFLSR